MEGLLTGICGTDLELVSGAFGSGRAGADHLVIGHESLGRVLEAPVGSGFTTGDLVAGVVRRPDPVPCPACARGEWDFCRNGQYTERGIKEMDGYGAERWRVDPYFAVPVPAALGELGVLVEPASILTKAWEQVDQVGAAVVVRTAARTGDGCRTDRFAGRTDRPAARVRRTRAGPR